MYPLLVGGGRHKGLQACKNTQEVLGTVDLPRQRDLKFKACIGNGSSATKKTQVLGLGKQLNKARS